MREYCGEKLSANGAVYDEDDCGYKIVDNETKVIGKDGLQKFTYEYKQFETKEDPKPTRLV